MALPLNRKRKAKLELTDEEQHHAPDSLPAIGHSYGTTTNTEHGTIHMGDNYYCQPNASQDSAAREHEDNERYIALQESLTFDRMDARLRNVEAPLANTCTWLRKHPQLMHWRDEAHLKDHDGFLWMKGKPGCGKSTLIKSLWDWVKKEKNNKKKHNPEWPRGCIVLSYFFNARASGALEKSSLGLYRSLVHSLLIDFPECRPAFMDTFAVKFRPGGLVEEWTVKELQNFLLTVVEHTDRPPVMIFIDALDENTEDDIRTLVDFLENFAVRAQSSQRFFRICLSSRHYPHITIKKGAFLILEDEKDHDRDIQTYLQSKLLPQKSGQIIDELRAEVFTKSSGIFLWVVLVIQLLTESDDQGRDIQAMKSCLDEFPEELDSLFSRILERNTEDTGSSITLLQWMLFSIRSLSPLELFLAIRYTSEGNELGTIPPHDRPVDESTLRKRITHCSRGLVEISKAEPPIAQFIHGSVREYLLRSKFLTHLDESLSDHFDGLGHNFIKQTCESYLNRIDGHALLDFSSTSVAKLSRLLDTTDSSHFGKEYPLVEYCTTYIFTHAARAHDDNILQIDFLRTLSKPRTSSVGLLQQWIKLRNLFQRFKVRRYSLNVSLLYIIVEEGHQCLVKVLCEDSVDVNQPGERYGTALQAAAAAGNNEIVRCLLENNANVNSEGGVHGHAIVAALLGKHEVAAQILLSAGAAPSQEVLRKATVNLISRGSVAGVAFLADMGVDLSIHRTGQPLSTAGATALHLAANKGQLEVFKWLSDRESLATISSKSRSQLISQAISASKSSIVRLLLPGMIYPAAFNAWLECQLLDDMAALWRSIDNGSWTKAVTSMVQVLLADKGDELPSIQNSLRLQAASGLGYNELAQALINEGADPDYFSVLSVMRAGKLTALNAAAYFGHILLVKTLLLNGANVNFIDDEGRSPLHHAVTRGDSGTDDIVSELLKYGADVNLVDSQGCSPLHHAAMQGHGISEVIVTKLLEYRADVNLVDSQGRSPLHHAAMQGHGISKVIVTKLLKYGADVNLVDSQGRSPLHLAIQQFKSMSWTNYPKQEAINKLLENGADIDAVDNDGCTPLDIADQSGRNWVIQLLLDRNGKRAIELKRN